MACGISSSQVPGSAFVAVLSGEAMNLLDATVVRLAAPAIHTQPHQPLGKPCLVRVRQPDEQASLPAQVGDGTAVTAG